MRCVEVTVDPQGRVTVEAKGYDGADCRNAQVLVLEKALGQCDQFRPTADYWNASNHVALQEQGSR